METVKVLEIKSFIHRETGAIYNKSRDPGSPGQYVTISIEKENGYDFEGRHYISLETAMKDPMMEIKSIKLLNNVSE